MASSKPFEALQFDFSAPGEPAGDEPVPNASGDLIEMVARVKAMARASESLEVRGPGSTPDEAISVAEFYERVRYALRSEFPADLWVTGEIRKVTVSKGNRYLELADRQGSADRAPATIDVACWSRDWPHIGARLHSVGVELAAALVVRIRGRVGVWDGAAKIRFNMTDLDVEALVGGIAAARRRLLATLQQEGLLLANKHLPMPVVPLRIGVVTSAGGEAYRDFTGALKRSGFCFDVRLEATLVQGQDAPQQIARAMRRLRTFEPQLIVVVRGGGAKGDLAAFDSESVARAIVGSGVPVWTGVGHTGDMSVADELAQRSCITPTACGEAVVGAVRDYIEAVDAKAAAVGAKGRSALERSLNRIEDRRARLGRAARHEIDGAAAALVLARSHTRHGAVVVAERHSSNLSLQAQALSSTVRHGMAGCEERLANRRAMLQAFDPRRQLARGWSLTRGADGRALRSVGEASRGEQIVTIFSDGSVTSTVESSSSEIPLASVPGTGEA
ncbi:MAG: exodeoxyribonuclease VII large subunit [Acidimicrobiales bacterium]